MERRASEAPREQALLEAFEPVALEPSGLRVRVRSSAQSAGYAASRLEQLAAMVRAVAGGGMRVVLDAPAPTGAPPRVLPAAGADDAIRNHPLVRKVAALFDATIVRVESASTLPGAAPPPAEPENGTTGEEHV